MNETKKMYCGVDISAETLDVCYEGQSGEMVIIKTTNNQQGFKEIVKTIGENHHYVMESTGVYHMELMFFLYDKGCIFTIENPLKIRRFIQMHLDRNKSDRKDARWICLYAIEQQPKATKKPDVKYFECRILNNTLHDLTKEITQITNRIHVLNRSPYNTKYVKKSYTKLLKGLREEKAKLEQKLHEKLKEWQPDLLTIVSSVIGIGKRAAAELIIFTQAFKGMKNYRQLISYAGLCPVEYSSGTSIRKGARISKQGGKQLRHILYMCALNAIKTNPACKALYQRLKAKGKNGKLAIIAVCNKLLRQVFGCVKNGIPFQKNYRSFLA